MLDELADDGFDAVHRPGPVRVVDPQLVGAPEAARRQQEDPVPLDFGLQIATFGGPGGAPAIGPRLAAVARAAEDAGFTSLWVMDHFVQIPQVGRHWDEMLDSWTTLGFLAGVTSRVTLGTMVTGVTYRNVAHLAKIAATLDVLSGGRAVCGLGAAWFEAEHKAYGFDFPPVRQRFRLLEDALQLLPVMWGPGAPAFKGQVIEVPEAICYPRPIQERIPILVGGGGEKRTLRLVARYADACNLFGDAATVRHKLEVLHRHCADVGRDPSEIRVTHLSVGLRRRRRRATRIGAGQGDGGHGGGARRHASASWPRRACRRPSSGWPRRRRGRRRTLRARGGRLPQAPVRARRRRRRGRPSRHSTIRSRARPTIDRGMRRAIDDRDGRVSATTTGSSSTRMPGPLGPDDELGVEQVGAEPRPLHQGHHVVPPQHLHPVGVVHLEPEPVAQDGAEHPRHQLPRPGPGVDRSRPPLAADDHRRPARLVEDLQRPGEKAQVVVVDVEDGDRLALGREEALAQGVAVVGLVEGQGADLGVLAGQFGRHRRGGVGGPVLDDDDLEGAAPSPQARPRPRPPPRRGTAPRRGRASRPRSRPHPAPTTVAGRHAANDED